MSDQDTNLFAGDQTSEPVSQPKVESQPSTKLEDWVGEGKKYSTPEEALNSVPHAQAYIASLQAKLDAANATVNKLSTIEEAVGKLLEKQSAQPPPSTNKIEKQPEVLKPEESKGLTLEDVKTLLNQTQQEGKFQSNQENVSKEMGRRFGSNAHATMVAKAAELGVTPEHLGNMAGNTPDIFLALFPQKAVAGTPQTGSSGSLTTVTDDSAPVRGFNYYEKMRKEEPTKFRSPAVQAQRQADRMKLGPEIWSKN